MTRQVKQYQPARDPSQSEHSLDIPVPHAIPGVSGPSLVADKKAVILKTRAHALARIPERQGTEQVGLSVIEFLVGEKTYAIEASYVREVQHFKELTPLPGTPPFVAGIINVRGRILAVVDVRSLLGLTTELSPSQDSVIILHSETRELGMLTDGLLGVHAIPPSQLYPIPPTLADAKTDYLRGVSSSQTIILHAPQLLADPHDPKRRPALSTADHDHRSGHIHGPVSEHEPASSPVATAANS